MSVQWITLYILLSLICWITIYLLDSVICLLSNWAQKTRPSFRRHSSTQSYFMLHNLGPVVQMPISAKIGLNFNQGFFIPLFKRLFGIIFPFLYRAFNNQIVDKKNYTEFYLKSFRYEIRFHINGYLNLALNNPILLTM